MSLLSEIRTPTRLARGLRVLLTQSLCLEEARAIIRRRMNERETNFLRPAEEGIIKNRRSPYRALPHSVRCEPGDFENLVFVEE